MPKDINALLGNSATPFERRMLEGILGKQSAKASALSKAVEALFEEFSDSMGSTLTAHLERIVEMQVKALEGEFAKLLSGAEHNISGVFQKGFEKALGINTAPGGFIPSAGQKATELTEIFDIGTRNL